MGREGSQFSIPSCRFRREMAARAPLAPRQQRFKVNRDGAVRPMERVHYLRQCCNYYSIAAATAVIIFFLFSFFF